MQSLLKHLHGVSMYDLKKLLNDLGIDLIFRLYTFFVLYLKSFAPGQQIYVWRFKSHFDQFDHLKYLLAVPDWLILSP